ncbi:MAG: HAD family phosphatase, partial [Treponema sp.]|nr:HAD family phosphatase [Treponema sp.]
MNDNFHPAGAIFDMDGLMLDTERPMVPLWTIAGKPYGYDIKPDVVIRTLGIDVEGTRDIMLAEYGPEFPYEVIREEMHRLAAVEYEKGISHRPGLVPLLDFFASRNIPMAVATSTRRDSALDKLAKAGIEERFTTIVCGDEISRGKPAPDIFLLAAKKLGKKPSECVGFEDSSPGLHALHAAGIRSVFVK